MAKKMVKKLGAKALKNPKAAKPAKIGVGAALKKTVKTLAKKAAIVPVAKKVEKKKVAPAPVPAKPVKAPQATVVKTAKVVATAAVSAKNNKKPAHLEAPVVTAKGNKKAAPAEAAPALESKTKAKKGKEVVVEVAAKGAAALLGKEGKRKKGEDGLSLSAKKRCREPGCDLDFSMSGYCRMHYIKNWRKIKRKEAILASGQLNNYVEELVSKYPDKYLEVIRQDLASEKDWAKVVVDLELESAEEDGVDEETDAVPEGVRSTGGREFDDDNDSF